MSQRKFNGESRYYQRGFFPPTQPYLRPPIWIFSRHSTNTYHTTLSHHWSSVLDKGKGAFVAALNIKGALIRCGIMDNALNSTPVVNYLNELRVTSQVRDAL